MDIYNYSVFAYSYSVSCVRRFACRAEATETEAVKCTVCGFKENAPVEALGDEQPGGEQPEKTGLSGGAIAGIAVGSVAVAGVGGFSVFWFVIKKKKFADLIAIFKKK